MKNIWNRTASAFGIELALHVNREPFWLWKKLLSSQEIAPNSKLAFQITLLFSQWVEAYMYMHRESVIEGHLTSL